MTKQYALFLIFCVAFTGCGEKKNTAGTNHSGTVSKNDTTFKESLADLSKNKSSKMNLSFATPDGSESREGEEETVEAKISGPVIDIQYTKENESLHFLVNEKGIATISGKLNVEDQSVAINPAAVKCLSTKATIEEEPEFLLVKFDCRGAQLKLNAEILVHAFTERH
jgi:hypothetical protein